MYYNFLQAVSLKYASTTFSVPTWWTGSKKKFSVVFTLLFNFWCSIVYLLGT